MTPLVEGLADLIRTREHSAVWECLERLLTTYSLKSREAYKLHRRFDFDTEIKAELKKLGEE